MSTETLRHIGRDERNFIIEWMEKILKADCRLGILGRDFFVERPADCLYWLDTLRRTLVAELEKEEATAKKMRSDDQRRGIPAWQTFRATDKRRAELKRFDAELAEAQKADAEKIAERERKRVEREAGEQPAATGTDSR